MLPVHQLVELNYDLSKVHHWSSLVAILITNHERKDKRLQGQNQQTSPRWISPRIPNNGYLIQLNSIYVQRFWQQRFTGIWISIFHFKFIPKEQARGDRVKEKLPVRT